MLIVFVILIMFESWSEYLDLAYAIWIPLYKFLILYSRELKLSKSLTDTYKQQIIWFQNKVSEEKYILGLIRHHNSFPVVLCFDKLSPWILVTSNCRWAGTAEKRKSEVIFTWKSKLLFCFKLLRAKTSC